MSSIRREALPTINFTPLKRTQNLKQLENSKILEIKISYYFSFLNIYTRLPLSNTHFVE